jgi:hypothetical protein
MKTACGTDFGQYQAVLAFSTKNGPLAIQMAVHKPPRTWSRIPTWVVMQPDVELTNITTAQPTQRSWGVRATFVDATTGKEIVSTVVVTSTGPLASPPTA